MVGDIHAADPGVESALHLRWVIILLTGVSFGQAATPMQALGTCTNTRDLALQHLKHRSPCLPVRRHFFVGVECCGGGGQLAAVLKPEAVHRTKSSLALWSTSTLAMHSL